MIDALFSRAGVLRWNPPALIGIQKARKLPESRITERNPDVFC